MHFLKLFLAGSFAVAAAIRATLGLAEPLGISNGKLMDLMSGPSGVALETLASFVLGGVVAARIASTKVEKASRD